MNGSRENEIIWTELVDVFEPLHGGLVCKIVAVLWQLDLIVDDIVYSPRLEHALALFDIIFSQVNIATL